MTEVTERLPVGCPSCSPNFELAHEVLTTGGGRVTVRCTECGHVHKIVPVEDETVSRRVVVSQDDESFTATVEAPADEIVRVGEEFIVDTEEAILAVRITDLEIDGEKRVPEAAVRDIETFWTRAIDNVAVNLTIHPPDGSTEETRSTKLYIPGDHEFRVGETESVSGDEVRIEGLLIRDDAVGYPTNKLDEQGDTAEAKDVKRVYSRDAAKSGWSAW